MTEMCFIVVKENTLTYNCYNQYFKYLFQVRILSTCLTEEKSSNRKIEEQLKKKKSEANLLLEQLGKLRSQVSNVV